MHHGKLLAVGAPHEVKKLMRGSILEIRVPEPRRATAVLREKLGKPSVGLFGDRVHVVTDDPEAARWQVEQILNSASLKVSGLRPIEPTLEDIFVSVLAGKEGAE